MKKIGFIITLVTIVLVAWTMMAFQGVNDPLPPAPTRLYVGDETGVSVHIIDWTGALWLYNCEPIALRLPDAIEGTDIVYIGVIRLEGTAFYLCETRPDIYRPEPAPTSVPTQTPEPKTP